MGSKDLLRFRYIVHLSGYFLYFVRLLKSINNNMPLSSSQIWKTWTLLLHTARAPIRDYLSASQRCIVASNWYPVINARRDLSHAGHPTLKRISDLPVTLSARHGVSSKYGRYCQVYTPDFQKAGIWWKGWQWTSRVAAGLVRPQLRAEN